jgi:predicted HD superfamily hydrolase involved in NAD metabolism
MAEGLQSELELFMSDFRLAHSKRVAVLARELAARFGVDGDKAYQAGLIHDMAKEGSFDSFSKDLGKSEGLLKEVWDAYPKVWHALVSPVLISYYLGVTDEAVLGACKWHTTGKAEMSVLEQIIFIADFVEPGRRSPHESWVMACMEEKLDYACLTVANVTIEHLTKQGLKIHPYTLQCRQYYRELCDGIDLNKLKV